MSDLPFQRIVLFGTGLIGGSLALALRRAVPALTVTGVDPAAGDEALARGVVDALIADGDEEALDAALAAADVVVLAAPVAQSATLLARAASTLRPDAVITDVGSVKHDIVAAACDLAGPRWRRFVPAHPIAGSEANGPAAARADLFAGKTTILCADAADADAAQQVAAIWRAVGARTLAMSAVQHDAVFSAVSHLPHVLAFAYLEQVLHRDDAAATLALAGSGFRDFTRIAASDPAVWRDICLANRQPLLRDIDGLLARLTSLRKAIASDDGAGLHRRFAAAANARRQWPAQAAAVPTVTSHGAPPEALSDALPAAPHETLPDTPHETLPGTPHETPPEAPSNAPSDTSKP
ncbi:prephenate dehydrogenase/arogenate dehydrogenase family protein [Chitinasiproducens palmae]|uniref:Prephenate dehydrogenase n=1 Tax=Chitinasiproducens palmae TaxID=1770053 RepID=A0A1H2PV24_9BURK|nr:prephenate dehydrogenase/arogenate dehydrogenase family protein [Chitinasiproducens palmae]SDV51096.1 prephenate dehydrogenase [Chitinasiproducens palmae]